MMKLAFYCNYGYYLNTPDAMRKLAEHGYTATMGWLGQDPYCTGNTDEHELYATARDCGLKVVAAYLPNTYLPYLANSRYGRKDAIRAYKQYVLSANENAVPTLVMDAMVPGEPYIEAMQEIVNYATEQGVIVCVRDREGVDMIGLLSRIQNLYYCLDTAACAKCGYDVIERIGLLNQRMLAVVLCDLALDDTRILPGSGKVDFAPILSAIAKTGYQGYIGIHATKAQGMDADEMLEAAKQLG